MSDSSRPKRWRVTVLLVVVAVGYFAFYYLPERKVIAEVRAEIQQKQDCIVEAGREYERVRAVEDELKQTEQFNAAWYRDAPSEGRLSVTYAQIQNLAHEAGTTITQFDPEPAARFETLSRVPVQVGCVGSFDTICEFLRRLEGLGVDVWEKEIGIKGTGEPGELLACELSLEVFASNSEDSSHINHSE